MGLIERIKYGKIIEKGTKGDTLVKFLFIIESLDSVTLIDKRHVYTYEVRWDKRAKQMSGIEASELIKKAILKFQDEFGGGFYEGNKYRFIRRKKGLVFRYNTGRLSGGIMADNYDFRKFTVCPHTS